MTTHSKPPAEGPKTPAPALMNMRHAPRPIPRAGSSRRQDTVHAAPPPPSPARISSLPPTDVDSVPPSTPPPAPSHDSIPRPPALPSTTLPYGPSTLGSASERLSTMPPPPKKGTRERARTLGYMELILAEWRAAHPNDQKRDALLELLAIEFPELKEPARSVPPPSDHTREK